MAPHPDHNGRAYGRIFPAEILVDIFLWHLRSEQARLDEGEGHIPKWKDWYAHLYVCRFWYQVAVGCPQMWDFVDISSTARCIRTMCERSGDVPLRVRPTGSSRHTQIYSDEGLRLIFAQGHRIRELSIFVTNGVAKVLSSLPSSPLPLPMVHDLVVSNEQTSGSSQIFPFEPSTSLTALDISGYTFKQVETALCPNIRHLSLLLDRDDDVETDDRSARSRPSLRRVTETLSTFPYLEKLIVRSWLENATYSFPSPMPFHSLRFLSLQLTSPQINFLDNLECPSGLALRLFIRCTRLEAERFQAILGRSIDICGISGKEGRVIRTISIDHTSARSFQLQLRGLPAWVGHNEPEECEPHLQLEFEYLDAEVDITGIYAAIIKTIHSFDVDTLTISFSTGQDIQVGLLTNFSDCPAECLRVLIDRECAECYLSEFLSTAETPSDIPSLHHNFPQFHEVLTPVSKDEGDVGALPLCCIMLRMMEQSAARSFMHFHASQDIFPVARWEMCVRCLLTLKSMPVTATATGKWR